jgi:hypothetical protein
MANKNDDKYLERITRQLADSVLALSDEDILAEVSEAGAEPKAEAERTRLVLRHASQILENVNRKLARLGHTINSRDWQRGQWGYHNTCVDCGSFVSFATATGETRGEAFEVPCSGRVYPMSRREVSR